MKKKFLEKVFEKNKNEKMKNEKMKKVKKVSGSAKIWGPKFPDFLKFFRLGGIEK